MVHRLSCSLIFWLFTHVLVRGTYKEGDVMLGGIFNVHFKGKEGQYGALYPSGLGRAEAMRFAIEKINNDSSLLPNVTLGYDIRDYFENATQALQITLDLIKEDCSTNTNTSAIKKKPIAALVGPFDSGTALLVGGLLQVFHIPGISGTTTSSELSSNIYKHFYRTVPSDRLQAKAMADIIEHFRWTYVAAVGLDDSYGRNGIWSVQKEATLRKTFCVAYTEFVRRNSQSQNIKDIVRKLKEYENIKVVILWIYGGYGRSFVAEAHHQNLTGRVWILSEGITSEGDMILDGRFSILEGAIGIQPHNYPFAEFQDYLQTAAYSKSIRHDAEWWREFWSLTGGCFSNKENNFPNETKPNQTSCNHILQDMYSAFVPYTIDAVYSVANALDMIYKHANNSQQEPFIVHGVDVEKNLPYVNFDGLTGNVEFDELGDIVSAFYDIVNFQHVQQLQAKEKVLKKFIVGKWEERAGQGNLSFNSELRWNSDFRTSAVPKSECVDECEAGTRKSVTSPCCWQCIPCLPGTVNPKPGSTRCMKCSSGKYSNEAGTKCVDLPILNVEYSSTIGIIILLVATFGFVTTITTSLVFLKFWDTPIVKASNRELSLIFLVGVASLFCLVIMNLVEPTTSLCKIVYLWRYETYYLCTSTLLVKILEISSAFQVKMIYRKIVGLVGIKQKALFLTISQISLLFIVIPWFCLDPPSKLTVVKPEEHTFIECKAYNTLVGKCLFMLTCLYIFIQTCLCAFCSFKVRKIPENFSETKRMAFSMYIFLLSLLTYHPVEFSIDGWYVTVIDCVTTLLSAFGFLACIFFPKIYIIFLKPELNNLNSLRKEVSQYSFKETTVHG